MNLEYDSIIKSIAEYTFKQQSFNEKAFKTASLALMDALGCAIAALDSAECCRVIGPIIPQDNIPNGVPIPGTKFVLDPVQAAFNIGTLIRWLDYNDTWLAAEWGHPSDNLGGLLAVSDYLCRNGHELTIDDLLHAMIKAYEIQGILALSNSFNKVGLDHVIFVKVATAAVVTHLLNGTQEQIMDAISHAWVDLGPLRTYRHAPHTGSRKSWAAGDATSRAVWLSYLVMKGEKGYPHVLSAKKWGLYDVLFQGKPFTLERPFASYVIENILFKVAFPAEFHAQTAIEAAFQLRPLIQEKWDQIKTIEIVTHESAIRIIDKEGPLRNYADRDHCLQYMVAVGLLYGEVNAESYSDQIAEDPRIDQLRKKMVVREEKSFSQDYLDPEKRAIPNQLRVIMKEGDVLGPVLVEYPLGHRTRRAEAIPKLFEKFETNIKNRFDAESVKTLIELFQDQARLRKMSVSQLINFLRI